MRLDKLLSNLKYGSRSDIKKCCRKGYVKVNNEMIFDSSFDVNEDDEIIFNDETVFHKERIILLMNKPKNYVCANIDNVHQTIFSLIKEPYNRYDLNVAGRLDIDTEGLLILTNDGNLLHEIISPKKKLYKKYYVEYDGKMDKIKLENGVTILDGNNEYFTTDKAIIEEIDKNKAYISITEGKFHQVKRMFESVNCKVTYLKRISIGNISLGDLEKGEYKEIPTI